MAAALKMQGQVLHPFYVFQIASIILWSLDNYYFYAVTIFLISALSIISTLIETRNNVERMREMSRFVCPIRLWRGGQWHNAESTELVPGDLIDVSEQSLHTFPADLLLLSGDAIVNESMLTGESVPVAKSAADDIAASNLANLSGNVPGDLTKHLLYAGTKVVRVRKLETRNASAEGGEAVALVLRTGFNTTKGALVRSMLFPKPMG